MRQTAKIESLSYGAIYITGCFVSLLLSFFQSDDIQALILHTLLSWGYVIYYVMNFN